MADQRVKQIKIKSGVVKRLAKEIVYYEKEAETEQARHDRMKEEGKDEHDLKKQQEVIQESKVMIPDTKNRLIRAQEELQKMIDAETDLAESEEYKDACKQLEEGNKVLATAAQ